MDNPNIDHSFGGAWTEIKLEILRKYLNFYTTALKKQNFELLYIDAFAGSGSRTEKVPGSPLFGTSDEKNTYDGSAKIALGLQHNFDRYLFIEKDKKRFDELSRLRKTFPSIKIQIKNGDANSIIQKICANDIWDKNKYRGVIFLDPYGNDVEWNTLEAIAKTKSFDVWFLFPISGVYRQAPHDPNKIEENKRNSLNSMFGTNDWEDAFYIKSVKQGLFGEENESVRVNVVEIENWITNRLSDCFKYVSKPLRLPQEGAQLFSLFFCVSNRSHNAVGLAIRAANFILKQHEH